MAPASHIVLDNLRKSFGPKLVLDGISLSVPKGRSLVVIGGSGTGKSVMIKCVLGLIKLDSGSIHIGGEDVTKLKPAERGQVLSRIGMLFQGSALFDSLPVWKQVIFISVIVSLVYLGHKVARDLLKAVQTMVGAIVGLIAAFFFMLPQIVWAGLIAFGGAWVIMNMNPAWMPNGMQ